MIRPAKRTTLYKDVINQIVEMIKKEEWPQGERIPGEIELARSFQVSRNCVREALKTLAHSAILDARPGLGTFLAEDAVRKIRTMELGQPVRDKNYFTELLQFRLMIEPEMVAVAAEQASDEDIQELERAVLRTDEALERGTYTVEIGFDFHMVLVRMMQNRVLAKVYDSIADDMKLQRGLLILRHLGQKDLFREMNEHKVIFQSIKDRNGSRARRQMRQHLKTAIKIMTQSTLVGAS